MPHLSFIPGSLSLALVPAAVCRAVHWNAALAINTLHSEHVPVPVPVRAAISCEPEGRSHQQSVAC